MQQMQTPGRQMVEQDETLMKRNIDIKKKTRKCIIANSKTGKSQDKEHKAKIHEDVPYKIKLEIIKLDTNIMTEMRIITNWIINLAFIPRVWDKKAS